MNKNKRGQSEIITTVLIILLVLAAIVIVWQVVRSTVTTGANQITGGTDCMTVSIDIIQAKEGVASSAKLTLKRNTGEGALAGVKVYINDIYKEDILMTTPALNELETKEYTLTSALTATTDKVKIAKVIGTDMNGKLCDFTDNSVGGITVIA